jgi:hypothetical protein
MFRFHNPILTATAILGIAVIVAAIAMILHDRAFGRTRESTPSVVRVTSVEEIASAVKACHGACVIKLAPANYGDLALGDLAPPPGMVEIDLTGSTFTHAYFPRDSNLRFTGGEVVRGNQWGFCWVVDGSHGVAIVNATADHCATTGFVITRSTDIVLLGWTATAPACDGVTISGTTGFVVSGGSYSGLTHGTSCHADGVQMWGMEGYPLKNGKVVNNTISSPPILAVDGRSMGAQGITAFANNAPGGGAFEQDNITVNDNTIFVHGSWCVGIFNTTHLTAQNNQCSNIQPKPWNGRYGWSGSSGTIGPNWMDNVQESAAQGDPSRDRVHAPH